MASTRAILEPPLFVAAFRRGCGQGPTFKVVAFIPVRRSVARVSPPPHGDSSRAGGHPAFTVAAAPEDGGAPLTIRGAPSTTITTAATAAPDRGAVLAAAVAVAVGFPGRAKTGTAPVAT